MNAVLREECEASVLTNEAIEVHLSYLRPAVEAIQTELPALRNEIKALDEKLNGKIDALDEKLSGKIDALDKRLSDKIDQKADKVDQKIDKLCDRITEIQANQKGLILFITTTGLIVSGISIARTLNWI